MRVNLNGVFWYDTDERLLAAEEIIIPKFSKTINPKTKLIATALWTMSATIGAGTSASAAGGSFFESMQPLNFVFQDIALGLGSLALIAGFVLLFIKRRWGTVTLKITAVVVGGVCLAPALLLLIAIVGTMMNDALWEAFQNIRQYQDVKGVMAQ